jgi:hypothetical protein
VCREEEAGPKIATIRKRAVNEAVAAAEIMLKGVARRRCTFAKEREGMDEQVVNILMMTTRTTEVGGDQWKWENKCSVTTKINI